ncbi:hypothetical protein LTS18_010269, partial [Coniosporium uncinatum]
HLYLSYSHSRTHHLACSWLRLHQPYQLRQQSATPWKISRARILTRSSNQDRRSAGERCPRRSEMPSSSATPRIGRQIDHPSITPKTVRPARWTKSRQRLMNWTT